MPTYAVSYYETRDDQGEPTQIVDIAYCDSYACMTAVLDAANADMRGQHAGNADTIDGVVEWGGMPAPDWPSYSVRCAHCGQLMHASDDES